MIKKPTTEAAGAIHTEILSLYKQLDELEIFPEKATKEKMGELRLRVGRLVDPMSYVCSNVSTMEEMFGFIDTKLRHFRHNEAEANWKFSNYPLLKHLSDKEN